MDIYRVRVMRLLDDAPPKLLNEMPFPNLDRAKEYADAIFESGLYTDKGEWVSPNYLCMNISVPDAD